MSKLSEIYFLHGNGIHPKAYRFLDMLSNDYVLKKPLMRLFWDDIPNDPINDWNILVDDFLHYISTAKMSMEKIGIGHSMGGTILLYSAIKKPDLFSKIILLDPVLFSPFKCKLWSLIRKFGLGLYFHPLAKKTMIRKKEFNSLESIFKRYRSYKTFQYFKDESLKYYINSIFSENNKNFKINYSTKLEVDFYLSALTLEPFIFKNLDKIKSKIYLMYPEYNNAASISSINRISSFLEQQEIQVKGLTHFFPMENEKYVFNEISQILG